MKLRLLSVLLGTAFFLPATLWAQNAKGKSGGKTTPRTLPQLYFESFAPPDGREALYYLKGSAYSYIVGQRPQQLFGIEGYNIRRYIPTPEKDGYFLATREVVFYTDPKTDEIIWEWDNPFTKEKNEVFHIANDPVNSRFRVHDGKYMFTSLDGKQVRGEVGAPQEWDDFYVWTNDAFPFYPLPGWEKNYTAAELFDFYIPKEDLNKPGPPRVMNSWTRFGPWLPWMKMDKHEGNMVYHARSRRYESWDRLPERIQRVVLEKFPIYRHAPDTVDPAKPNETSWTYYNRMMKERQKQ
jgi:Protein of unknown function (DUF1838)